MGEMITPRQQTLLHILANLADDIKTGAVVPGRGFIFRGGEPCDAMGHLITKMGDPPSERLSCALLPLLRLSGYPPDAQSHNALLGTQVPETIRDMMYINDNLPLDDETRGPSIAAELLKLRDALICFYAEVSV